ncbi:MAG: hypothetical protein MRZ66_09240 [Clostridiales bacterium]|nr:hypothetical protein [Clostridiales bacterium]
MGKKFKWDMIITSFIPLWISIIIVSCFDIGKFIAENPKYNQNLITYLFRIVFNMRMMFILILIVVTVLINSIIGINSFLKTVQTSGNKQNGKIMKSKKASSSIPEFLIAYILPMIAFDFTEIQGIILFCVYFFILSWLCIRNNDVYTNILLEIKKYKMYKCDIECNVLNGKVVYYDSIIISKQDLTMQNNNFIEYWDFDKYIYVDLTEAE